MARTSLRTKLAAVAATGVMALGTGVLAASPAEASAAADCPYTYFCAWEGPNFTGAYVKMWQCSDVRAIPWWSTNGSWINNQTSGTRARFILTNGSSVHTYGAYYAVSGGINWGTVAQIDPC
ncbi:peptidase inhibitor family I36 protein [Streptomyces sp. NBC_00335]|uniref:peptidase inhibitor family I36 protein n=1 Tax=unclassified Streptomyces TaxID=2593676 RepID=UPI00224F0918|nr:MULTISPECIES: peptidase inhibitor family I36 protein [unclassified Streptomyces]MCX5405860.1 peptidase inhibitor family I36 protein [Streptomyces sp. NBC_00086]